MRYRVCIWAGKGADMLKRKQERIYSRIEGLNEMESGFPLEKEELKDQPGMVAAILARDISEQNSDKQTEPAETEEILVTCRQDHSIYLLPPGLQSLPSPETSPSSIRSVSHFWNMKRIMLLLFAALIGVAALNAGKAFHTTDIAGVNEDLRQAVSRGDLPEVRRLLSIYAEVNVKNKMGETALIVASREGYREIVQELLQKGAAVNAKSNTGVTALMFASANGHREIVQELLEKGAAVNARRNTGGTALIFASGAGCREIVQELLENGAEVNARDNDGVTALIFASAKGHREIVQELLAKGADVDAKMNNHVTALAFASTKGHRDVKELLIKAGAK